MPLPDADPDKRMYKLLKNIDLENLTFEQFQSTAQTVFAEPESEDTLRRIVLIQMSRMAVAGDWNGLTTAAGTTNGMFTAPVEVFTGSTGALVYRIPAQAAGGLVASYTTAVGMYLMPFMGTDASTIDAFQIYAANTTGTTTLVGVYSTDTEGLPDTLLTQASFTTSSTGVLTQTSVTGTFTMVKGVSYYLSWIVDHAGQQYATIRYSVTTPTSPFPALSLAAMQTAGYTGATLFDASVTSLPASPTMSGFEPYNISIPLIGLRTS